MAVGPLHGTHEPPFYVCGSDHWVVGYMEGAVRPGGAAAAAALRVRRRACVSAVDAGRRVTVSTGPRRSQATRSSSAGASGAAIQRRSRSGTAPAHASATGSTGRRRALVAQHVPVARPSDRSAPSAAGGRSPARSSQRVARPRLAGPAAARPGSRSCRCRVTGREDGRRRVGLADRASTAGVEEAGLSRARGRTRRTPRSRAAAATVAAARAAAYGARGRERGRAASALRPRPVGDLDGPEQLLLEPVGGALVEQLVRAAERRQRRADPSIASAKLVEQPLPRLLP